MCASVSVHQPSTFIPIANTKSPINEELWSIFSQPPQRNHCLTADLFFHRQTALELNLVLINVKPKE